MDAEATLIDTCDLKMVDPDKVAAVRLSLPKADDVVELADVFSSWETPAGCDF